MSLKEQLGEENYKELLELVQPASSGTFKAWLIGALKSTTNWFAGFVFVLPDILMWVQQTLPEFQEFMTPEKYNLLIKLVAAGVVGFRMKTKTSLVEKGAK